MTEDISIPSNVRRGLQEMMDAQGSGFTTFYTQPEGMLRAMGKWNKDTTDEELRERAEALGFPNFNSNGRQKIPDPLDIPKGTGGLGAPPPPPDEEEEEEDCEVFFSAGHEFTPDDMQTKSEKNAMHKAWFSDLAKEQHAQRIEEERLFLLKDAQDSKKLTRMPAKSTFKHPERTIPVGVGPFYSIALEFVNQRDADTYALQMRQAEIDQLCDYFRERLQRAFTVKQVRNVGGELNTRVKMEKDDDIRKVLLDTILPLILDKLTDPEGKLIPGDTDDHADPRGQPVAVPDDELPTHTITQISINNTPLPPPPQKKKKGKGAKGASSSKETKVESADLCCFRVLGCPTPLPKASHKATQKKCVWEPFFIPDKIFTCDTGTVPLARIHEVYLLLCYRINGVLRVQVFSLENRIFKTVYSYDVVEENEQPLKDCHFDYVSRKIALAFDDYVMIIILQDKPTTTTTASIISLKCSVNTQIISAVYIGYGDVVIGTTRGAAISYCLDEPMLACVNPPIYQQTPSTCPILSIHRTGGNLYATNIMWTINLQTPDVNSYVRGLEVSTVGSIFYQDRVVGVDSCGALLASLDKSGILQIQTNRLCADPKDMTKLLSSQVYSPPPPTQKAKGKAKEIPLSAIFISYRAVYLARKQLLCMYPDGHVQSVWLLLKE